MMRPRITLTVLVITSIAWAVPTSLALWLDIERFVHPYCEGASGYEQEPRFQAFAFMLRFGWWLIMSFIVLLIAQAGILKQNAKGL